MEVSALKYHGHGSIGVHGRSPLLRLRSDEQLIALLRRGNTSAFEVLVSRYESRLLAFCRHLLGSREDAEDVLQEVMTAAFNAIIADDRPINVRPWLYRIARNRSLNHLRRTQAIAVDTMDYQLSEHGATTADKVHEREEFRVLVGDIQDLPETQKTALVLREMDALSYEQIAEAMETTVSSVKSLLVRARLSLAEAAEARALSCEEVRIQLAEVAEGLLKRPSPLVKRHLKGCERCSSFRTQLKHTNRALAALLPVGPLVVAKKFAFLHFGHSATTAGGTSATAAGGATAAGSAGAGAGALAGAGAFSGGGGFVSAGLGAVATKAAAGLAAAALVTAGAVEVNNSGSSHHHRHAQPTSSAVAQVTPPPATSSPSTAPPAAPTVPHSEAPSTVVSAHQTHATTLRGDQLNASTMPKTGTTPTTSTQTPTDPTATSTTSSTPTGPIATTGPTSTLPSDTTTVTTPPGRTVTQTSPSMPTATTTTTTAPPVVLPPTTTTPPTITSTTPTVTSPTTAPTTSTTPAPTSSVPTTTRPALTTGTLTSAPPTITNPLAN
jgi:RNA polymerase sigma factor (sigma-70 family)